MDNKTNTMTAKIMEYRGIGKLQLNADDMGGVGCSTWDEYLKVCDILAVEAWNHTIGRSTDNTLIDTCVAGLLDFFGISYIDSKKHNARILISLVDIKPNRSKELKDAIKAKTAAKNAWDKAIAEEKSEEEISALKEAFEKAKEELDELYTKKNHYWFDPAPMFDKRTQKATDKARKRLEDACADIFSERQFKSADELQKEQQELDDQRRGRRIRQKEEAKQAKSAK